MGWVGLSVVAVVVGVGAWGQQRAVGEMVDVAMGAGPEAGADVLLGLLEKGRIGDGKLRRRVLEDVWGMAGRVGDAYPRTGVTPAYSERTEAGRQLMLSELGVDGLSIRSRVLRLMAVEDGRRAREWFWQMPGLEVPVEDCGTEAVPMVGGYYDVARVVFEKGFGAEERREGLDVRFLEEVAGQVGSPVAVAAAAAMLNRVEMGAEARGRVVGVFGARMGQVRGGVRAFYVAVRRMKLMDEVASLMEGVGEERAYGLATGLRAFLEGHLKAARCADVEELERGYKAFREDTARLEELRKRPEIQVNVRRDVGSEFNERFAGRLRARGLEVEPMGEVRPERIVEVKREEWAASAERREVEARVRAVGSEEEFAKALEAVERFEWKEEKSRLEAVLVRAGLYGALMEKAKDEGQAGAVARAWVGFLSDPAVAQVHGGHWVQMVREVARQAQALTAEARAEVVGLQAKGMSIAGVNALAAGALERAMAEARDPVIVLYGRVGREFGERRAGWR